jgi:acyl carrier protein
VNRDCGPRLRLLVAETLRIPVESIVDTLDMQATGTWDSLSHMELIGAIEDAFGVDLTANEIIAMTSVARIADVLRAKSVDL